MKTKLLFFRIMIMAAAIIISSNVLAKKHIIQVRNYAFSPDTIQDVETGDSIIWQWINGTHTTTSTQIPVGAETWDSELSEASPGFVYVVNTPGEYKYVCTPHASMGMVGMFTVKTSSGIGDNNGPVPAISIFPNPFNEQLTFRYDSRGKDLQRLEIFDLTGKKVFDTSIGLNTGADTSLNLADLDAGIYIIRFVDEAGNSYARRVNKR